MPARRKRASGTGATANKRHEGDRPAQALVGITWTPHTLTPDLDKTLASQRQLLL